MRTRSSRGSLNLQSYLLLCLTTITFIGTSFRRSRVIENSVSEGGTALVAIVLCTKSVGSWKGVQDSSLVSILLPSVTRTVTRAELQRLRLEIFAAYDVDDVFWNTYANRRTACESFRLPINFMAIRKESKRIPLKREYEDNTVGRMLQLYHKWALENDLDAQARTTFKRFVRKKGVGPKMEKELEVAGKIGKAVKESAKQWPVSDQAIQKFWSYYAGKQTDDDLRTLAAEEWSDKFTDEQIDSGEFDEFIDHAADVFKAMYIDG